MRQFQVLLLTSCVFLIAACGGTDSTSPESAPASNETPAAKTPAKKRRAYTEEELNRPYSTVSPWRYIVTGPETQYFERLVGYSELGRVVHGSGHAVLVPRDETFRDNKDWKALIEPENMEALQRFVKAHILVGIKSKKSIEGTYENLNGQTVVIEKDDRGELVCGGARLLGQEVETDHGLVLPVVGMVEPIQWD